MIDRVHDEAVSPTQSLFEKSFEVFGCYRVDESVSRVTYLIAGYLEAYRRLAVALNTPEP